MDVPSNEKLSSFAEETQKAITTVANLWVDHKDVADYLLDFNTKEITKFELSTQVAILSAITSMSLLKIVSKDIKAFAEQLQAAITAETRKSKNGN